MSNCCAGLDAHFDARHAERRLRQFRRKGPPRETRLLVTALREAGVEGATVLDIGGGIGAVQDGLFDAGAARAVSVDASGGYLSVAESLAAERGYRERVEYRPGDFVHLAERLDAAEVVTLDKVICCYPDMEALVARSAEKALRLYGAVYPRDTAPVRTVIRLENVLHRLSRREFRAYVHPERRIEETLRARGLHPRSIQRTLAWKIVVFERAFSN